MKKRQKQLKKQRKRLMRNQEGLPKDVKLEMLAFCCSNCDKKMDILDNYHWSYGFCSIRCGNEMYGV